MKIFLGIILTALSMATLPVSAKTAATPYQDANSIRQTVERFLSVQTASLYGEVEITVGALDARLHMPACTAPQAFMPQGSKAWGKTTVGVRCTSPSPWTIYVAAQVQVSGEYLAAAVPLTQGQTLTVDDITTMKGDLTALPPGVITRASQAIGHTTASSVRAGAPLRYDILRTRQVIKQGQTVRVVYSGPGFSISSEARAINNAREGQITQARTQGGRIMNGIARAGGVIEMVR